MAPADVRDRATLPDRIPVLSVTSLDDPFTPDSLRKLAETLPDYIRTQRWYRAKARTIQEVEVHDFVPIAGIDAWIAVLRIIYAKEDPDMYLLPVSIAESARSEDTKAIARLKTQAAAETTLHSALSSSAFRAALLNVIASRRTINGRAGKIIASRTSAFHGSAEAADLTLPSFVSRAEQSNTSIVYGERFILKLFRKIEPGINPDVEIGTFLTEQGFKHTPAVLGTLEYQSSESGCTYAAGILQEFVPNQGDAWKYTLAELNRFFLRTIQKGKTPPRLGGFHPMEMVKLELSEEERALLGDYVWSADLLGKRTAEMHVALSGSTRDHDFAPEPAVHADREKLYQEMIAQAEVTFDLLRQKKESMLAEAAEGGRALLQAEQEIRERFSRLLHGSISTSKIRIHGDYHLGQVLYTGSDFMIIDFEGEPARPLHERRSKTLALRDVAGMLRSFQYAAYAALLETGSTTKTQPGQDVVSWADFWTACVSAIFLRRYFENARGRGFLPADTDECKLLLDAFLLHKALYEVAYELNNRPDWVRIPLRGILALVS